MSQAHLFIKKATKMLEQRKHTFILETPTPGMGFTFETPHLLPAGNYATLETDSRDHNRVIVLNLDNSWMYALEKRKLP